MLLREKWVLKEQEEDEPRLALSPHQKLEGYLNLQFSNGRHQRLLEGAGLVLLGLACFPAAAAPAAASIPIEWLLILAGAVMLISLMRAGQSATWGYWLALALIPFAASLYLLAWPREATADPGLVFAAYFAASGTGTALLAAACRRRRFPQWEWLAVSGVASLLCALLILSGLPGPFVWMFGVLLGVALIFDGSARLALALVPHYLREGNEQARTPSASIPVHHATSPHS
jgi:uncharacterized membrane protein HdeD (DUF308 family)